MQYEAYLIIKSVNYDEDFDKTIKIRANVSSSTYLVSPIYSNIFISKLLKQLQIPALILFYTNFQVGLETKEISVPFNVVMKEKSKSTTIITSPSTQLPTKPTSTENIIGNLSSNHSLRN